MCIRDRDTTGDPFVSTGRLPMAEMVQALVDEAHTRFKDNDEGVNASHYPALAFVPRHLFGICITGVSGREFMAGDVDAEFTIMSVAKPFTPVSYTHLDVYKRQTWPPPRR